MIRKTSFLPRLLPLLGALIIPSALTVVAQDLPPTVAEKITVKTSPGEALGTKPRKFVGVLDTNDKIQATFFVPRVFEVKNANPHEISKFVEDAVRTEGGLIATYANLETNSEGESSGGLILVVVPEYQLKSIGETIKRLDRSKVTNFSGTKFAFVGVENRSVSNRHLAENNPALAGLTTDFVKSLLVYGGPDTHIDVDIQTNSLMITGAPSGVDAVVGAMADYDKARPQISIAVKVYEVDTANDAALGLDFIAWKNGPGQNLFSVNNRKYKINDQRGSVKSHGYNFDYSAEFFDFLSVKGKSRVTNELRGTVINGFEAVFNMKDQILAYVVPRENRRREVASTGVPGYNPALHAITGMPFFTADGLRQKVLDYSTTPPEEVFPTTDTPIKLSQPAPPPATVAVAASGSQLGSSQVARTGSVDGLVLRVKPLISRQNIDLSISTQLETFLGFDDTGRPQVSVRDINTEVRASSGEEVVLGGMERTRDIKMTKKVPILGSIPVLGYLFGGEITGKKATTVYELITPTIIEKRTLDDEDSLIVDQVEGNAKTQMPADEYFFGQYLLGQ